MKGKAISLFVAGTMLAGPAGLAACDTWLNYRFLPTMSDGPMVGAGLNFIPGEDGGNSGLIITGDVAFSVAEGKGAVAPVVGYCKFGDFNETILGVAGAFNVFNNPAGTFALNVQVAATRGSYDGGNEMYLPVGVAGSFDAAETFDLTFGAGLNTYRDSYEGSDFGGEPGNVTQTEHAPYAFVGGALDAGENLRVQGGININKWEYGTDVNLSIGVGVGIG